MVHYKILFKTGDKIGAGTNANVFVRLRGPELNTEETNLRTHNENVFTRSSLHECFLESEAQIGMVQNIELWRDNAGWFSSWYIDWIEVVNMETRRKSMFQVQKWIKEDIHYIFNDIHTCLPQDDPFQNQRQQEIATMRGTYQLEVKVPGLPAQVKELPEDEKLSYGDNITFGMENALYLFEAGTLMATNPNHNPRDLSWSNADEVKDLYTNVFGIPRGSQYFNDDASFGRQRLTGLNPSLIQLCTNIPPKFGVTEEMIKGSLDGKTIRRAIAEQRLFIVDLEIMRDCPTMPDRNMACPIALFYFNNDGDLMPVAIQLFQPDEQIQNRLKVLSRQLERQPVLNRVRQVLHMNRQDEFLVAHDHDHGHQELFEEYEYILQERDSILEEFPVFLPTDHTNTWMLAKMWYNLADATYHQALTHLNFTHLMMEGISVATKRNLASSHPILKLLNPHFLYLMAINSLALGTLINSGGIIDKTSNAGIKGHFEIMRKGMEWWRLDLHGTLPEDLKRRGVFDDDNVLPGVYHMRDDALLLYKAIETYVIKYVDLYYTIDGSMIADEELQDWGKELVLKRENGGLGIRGVPNKGIFHEKYQLVSTLTPIIYTCSVGHAAANFQQYDEYAYPFNYPFSLSGEPPVNKDPVLIETILEAIAQRNELPTLMYITKVLSQKTTQSLGDFEKQLIVDPPAIKIVEEFRQKLLEVGHIIDERNKGRKHPYEWLHPMAIPNAISI